jgi:hypothetical protein
VSVTTRPTGPASSWRKATIDRTVGPDGNPSDIESVGCVSATACVAGDSSQNGFFSAAPASGAWSPFAFPSDTYVSIKALGCSPQGNCTALGVDGHALSTPSLGAGSRWSFIPLPGTDASKFDTDISSVSCPSTTCVAAESGSGVYVTKDAGATWTSVKLPGASGVFQADCVTATFCIAGADEGARTHVWISHDPSGSWRAVKAFNKVSDVTAVACASAHRCFVASGGDVYSSSSPASGSWKKTNEGRVWGGILSQLSCPTARLCVGADQFGDIGVARL